jgi:hypothetical protein
MYTQVKNDLACGKFARKFGKEVLIMKQKTLTQTKLHGAFVQQPWRGVSK